MIVLGSGLFTQHGELDPKLRDEELANGFWIGEVMHTQIEGFPRVVLRPNFMQPITAGGDDEFAIIGQQQQGAQHPPQGEGVFREFDTRFNGEGCHASLPMRLPDHEGLDILAP